MRLFYPAAEKGSRSRSTSRSTSSLRKEKEEKKMRESMKRKANSSWRKLKNVEATWIFLQINKRPPPPTIHQPNPRPDRDSRSERGKYAVLFFFLFYWFGHSCNENADKKVFRPQSILFIRGVLYYRICKPSYSALLVWREGRGRSFVLVGLQRITRTK